MVKLVVSILMFLWRFISEDKRKKRIDRLKYAGVKRRFLEGP